ncbi:PspC domain-containing protein [Companilactobacillus sp.]|uniref:PspC domain-containing protein n=1 Tax=Companilactobacillus sp. TaxID=2767905 RepID=UPI00262E30B2|nr:PspC domain-containing protein [Companilactobacillus sp.]
MHIPIKRSKNNKILAGVIGGLAEHYDWNVAVARVLFFVLSVVLFTTGLGVIAYLLLWLLMENPETEEK